MIYLRLNFELWEFWPGLDDT